MQTITPYLWFDREAEEAAERYVAIFSKRGKGESRILNVSRYGEGGPVTPGTAMVVGFELEGMRFLALNGGPDHRFSDAVSFLVDCESQDEVDELWDALTADGGEPGPCGWLKDRYGLSWQVVPRRLTELLSDPDPERARRATEAMLKMQKIDIAELERAADAT